MESRKYSKPEAYSKLEKSGELETYVELVHSHQRFMIAILFCLFDEAYFGDAKAIVNNQSNYFLKR